MAKPIVNLLASDGLSRKRRREYACAAMGDEATGMADGTAEGPDGIDRGGVEAWFGENVPGVQLPLSFDRISGGHSNLTYGVRDAGSGRWALRRPPLGKRLGSAHDMGREHKVVSALGPTDVPVAPVVGLCEDESVNEAPFYVMEFVEGPILRGLAEAEAFPEEADRRAIGERVADTLVEIHAVDPDAVGLGDLGRKEDYVARQLRRWQGQWKKSKTRELPAIDAVHERLEARIPAQGPATIVHGDYRLDNMILTPGGEVAAVVDWELCTLGDPLADVGLLMVYWPERGEASPPTSPRASPPARSCASATPSAPAATSPSSASSKPSATGSWRSSSKASTPATPPASTARSTRALNTSPGWSSGSPRRPIWLSGGTDLRQLVPCFGRKPLTGRHRADFVPESPATGYGGSSGPLRPRPRRDS
jgi:aminoglycoside phosphotransferase (APT) family kinase protein